MNKRQRKKAAKKALRFKRHEPEWLNRMFMPELILAAHEYAKGIEGTMTLAWYNHTKEKL